MHTWVSKQPQQRPWGNTCTQICFVYQWLCITVCVCLHLVVCVELLVLSLTLPEGLPLGLQCLGQVSVLQTFLRVLLWQHLQFSLNGLQLLPRQSDHHNISWSSHLMFCIGCLGHNIKWQTLSPPKAWIVFSGFDFQALPLIFYISLIVLVSM